jgi:hypothetical protein
MGAPQPNFSMKGRTAASLIRQVERWHGQLGRGSVKEVLYWEKSGIHDFVEYQGSTRGEEAEAWIIRELLNSQELFQEGRELKHCVSSYSHTCYEGVNSIWSLERVKDGEKRKKITIQVINKAKLVSQTRGLQNRYPTEQEKLIIRKWAQQEGLEITVF